MSEIFKTFRSGEKKITPTVTHKEWEVNKENSASLGIEYLVGSHRDHKAAQTHSLQFNITDPLHGGGVSTPLTAHSGREYYSYTIHKSIEHLYYGLNDNPYDSFCNDAPHLMNKNLDHIVSVLSIPSTIYGEKVKPGSLIISTSAMTLTDDGNGNLRDLNDYSGSTASTTLSSSLLFTDFTDAWKKVGQAALEPKFYTTSSTYVESAGNYQAKAYNVNWHNLLITPTNGETRGYISFHGSQSLQESNSIDNPSDSSFVVFEGTRDMDLENDWAISLWVKCPESQSVTESYSGHFVYVDGSNEDITRELKTKSKSTILTTREWWGNNCPFELQIINQNHAGDFGKLRVYYKSKTEGWWDQVTSTGTYNDGQWHHVLITAGGADNKCYLIVDGTDSNNEPYIPTHLNTRWPTELHLGARPYHWKQRYWNKEHQKYRDKKDQKNYIEPFSGSISSIRLYDQFINPSNTELIKCVSASVDSDNCVGNVFYEHGIATVTATSNTDGVLYQNIWPGESSQVYFKGTHAIKEHIYICNILDGEFNATYNPTAREKFDERNDNLQAYTTHSEFNPYVTTIGLYNDQHELLAIGKLAQPIKNQDDYDNTFQVRFDTTI